MKPRQQGHARRSAAPRISVVVLTYYGGPIVDACIASIVRQTVKPHEVILVDNGPTRDTINRIHKRFKGVKLIHSGENLGYAGGNNLGMRAASGDYLLILNDDTVIEKDCIARIIRGVMANKDPSVGMWALKMVIKDTRTIDTIGFSLDGLGISREIRDESGIGDIAGPCGGAAVYSRRLLTSIAQDNEYFDGRFFMYSEDVDLAWRARNKGWRTAYLPITVHHHHGASTTSGGRVRDAFIYLQIRNRVLSFRKNRTYYAVFILPFIALNIAVWLKYALRGKGTMVFRAILDGFIGRISKGPEVIKRYPG